LAAFCVSIVEGALMTWTITEDHYKALVKSDEDCLHGLREIQTQVALIVRLLNGNPDEDIPGVRPRLLLVERRMNDIPGDLVAQLQKSNEKIETLTAEWNKLKERYNGAKWVLGILGVTNVATLGVLARMLTGGL
jgi:hypothetical protein